VKNKANRWRHAAHVATEHDHPWPSFDDWDLVLEHCRPEH